MYYQPYNTSTMHLNKLKLDKFRQIKLVNFPDDVDMGIQSSDSDVDVLIYYIDSVDDVAACINLANLIDLPLENRVIMIYQKGRKDGVNRDSIFLPFKEGLYPDYGLKSPMLCSLADKLSAIVLGKRK